MTCKTFKPEIFDFDNGIRDVILLEKGFVKNITRKYAKVIPLDIKHTNAVLVFAYDVDAKWFKRLLKFRSLDFATGRVLGIPEKVVDWFDNSTEQDKKQAGGVIFGSLVFKCPDSLLVYAYNTIFMDYVKLLPYIPLIYSEPELAETSADYVGVTPQMQLIDKIHSLKGEEK